MRSRNTRAPLHFLDTSPPGPWKGRFKVAGAESTHAPACKNKKGESLKILPFALERKTGRALALRASDSRILADTPGPWKGRFEVACAESPHAPAYEKREEPFGFFPLLERKTDFRPKHIPRLQSAYYMKHFSQRSLPRCGHHALVCTPMLSTKIRIIFTQFKNAIQAVFCTLNPMYFHPCLSTKSIRLRIAPCRNRRQYWVWEKSCQKRSSHYGQQDYSA